VATLQRRNGSQTFKAEDLARILASLRLSNQAKAYQSTPQLCFMNATFGLLVVDVAVPTNLRLCETFDVRFDSERPYGLAFFAAEALLDINEALQASGFAGPTPVASVDAVNMTFWGDGGGDYVRNAGAVGAAIVRSGGVFGISAAQARRLTATGALDIEELSDTINLHVAPFVPPDLSPYVLHSVFDPWRAFVDTYGVFVLTDPTLPRTRTRLSESVQLVDTLDKNYLLVSTGLDILAATPVAPGAPVPATSALAITPTSTTAPAFRASDLLRNVVLGPTSLLSNGAFDFGVSGTTVLALSATGADIAGSVGSTTSPSRPRNCGRPATFL